MTDKVGEVYYNIDEALDCGADYVITSYSIHYTKLYEEETGDMFNTAKSRLEVEQLVVDNMDKIQETAEQVVQENGYDYDVKCELTYMEFDERVYDNFTLPAGYYDALRITIGEAT